MRATYAFLFLGVAGACAGTASGQGLSATRTAGGIEIREGKSRILFYQVKPKSLNGKYERANYIHPLYGLNGTILTEDFPDDHPHHRGIFWAWHQIIINNKPVADGWSCENISWEVVNTDVRRKRNAIALNNEVVWKSSLDGAGESPVVRERSVITVHAARGRRYRIIDFDITLSASTGQVALGGSDDAKGYGGFSLRIRLPDDLRFISNEGEVQPRDLAVTAGPWLDFYGSLEGESFPESGVAVFCHPSNPGDPEPWILRSAKSMQNPAYPGRTPVKLTAQGTRLRYRIVVHGKNAGHPEIRKLFEEYKGR